jgi:hypothetical protein
LLKLSSVKSRNLANKDVDSVSPELLARRGGLLATIHGGNTLATQVDSGPSHVPSDLLRGWRRISVPEMAEGLKPQWAPRSSGFPWTNMWRLVSAERPHDSVDTYLRFAEAVNRLDLINLYGCSIYDLSLCHRPSRPASRGGASAA